MPSSVVNKPLARSNKAAARPIISPPSEAETGVKSLISSLGTDEFARCKVGVGRGEEGQGDLADHVLCKFLVEEQPVVDKSLDRAVAAVKDAVSLGIRAAMTEYNRKTPLDEPASIPETHGCGSEV